MKMIENLCGTLHSIGQYYESCLVQEYIVHTAVVLTKLATQNMYLMEASSLLHYNFGMQQTDGLEGCVEFSPCCCSTRTKLRARCSGRMGMENWLEQPAHNSFCVGESLDDVGSVLCPMFLLLPLPHKI